MENARNPLFVLVVVFAKLVTISHPLILFHERHIICHALFANERIGRIQSVECHNQGL